MTRHNAIGGVARRGGSAAFCDLGPLAGLFDLVSSVRWCFDVVRLGRTKFHTSREFRYFPIELSIDQVLDGEVRRAACQDCIIRMHDAYTHV